MSASPTIFVVDDHESTLASVKGVLTDESYRIEAFHSAEALLEGLQDKQPDVVLLDIWLPGMDGVEALKRIKAQHPTLPVMLMSGHAGVDIAVSAMQAGAADFLEKPLNLDLLLEKLARLVPASRAASAGAGLAGGSPRAVAKERGVVSLEPGRAPQRTIRKTAVMNGVGLLSGRPTGIIISPMPVDSGITFSTMDGVDIPARVTELEGFGQAGAGKPFTANSTVLARGSRRVRTVEHLLASLHMLGITNATIKVNGEIPNIDGSAVDYCRVLLDAGIEDQPAPRREIVIHRRIGLGDERPTEKYLFAEPHDGFVVELRVAYPAPIHEQTFRFDAARHSFLDEIAPARSFNTFENIDMAQKAGMVGSGYLNSHIIIHDGKVINTTLKFPDEFVRHKILDLLGDLYLLGYPVRGRIVGNMTSHGLNQAFAVAVHEALAAG